MTKKLISSIFKILILSLFAISDVHLLYAQTAGILPNAKTTFVDKNGSPLTSGKVYFYQPGGTTAKTTWQDINQTTPNTNPVLLDDAGRALIWGSGSYRQQVFDQFNNLQWDQVTSGVGSAATTNSGDGNSVGTVLPWSGFVAPAQYMFAYGQGVSRATYSQLLATLTQKYTISCTGGSGVLNGFTDTTQIPIGAPIETSCLLTTGVVTAKSANTVTVNTPANVSIVTVATVFPYGNGDGSTSFNLPDYRGSYMVGRCNMGGVGCTNLTAAYYGNDPNGLNVPGGNQSYTLTLSNLPSGIQSSGNNAITVTPSGGGTGIPVTSSPGNVTTSAVTSGSGVTVPSSTAASWGGTGTFSGTNNIQVTSTNTNTNAPHPIIPPSKTVNYVIKVTPDISISGLFGVSSLGGMQGTVVCGSGLTCAGGTINTIPGSTTGIIGLTAGSGIALSGQCATNLTGSCTITASPASNTNPQTANYTIQNTDCGKTVLITGGQFTATLPSTSGFTEGCTVYVKNGDTGAGKALSGFPAGLTSPNMEWPLQTLGVQVINSAWRIIQNPGRWQVANLNLFVNTSGTDSNDGLTSATSIRHLDMCRAIAQLYIDTISQGNGGITCNVQAGQTFQEFVQVFFPLVGGGTLIYQGNGGQFNWVPANGSYALQFGDLGVVGLTNVNFTTSGASSAAGLILGHNYGVLDVNSSVSFHSDSPGVTTMIDCDFDTHFNINNGFLYSGTITSFLFRACQNSAWNINNNISTTTTTAIGRLFWANGGSTVTFQGNVTWGATGLTTSVALVSGNSVVNNLGGALPGGAPSPTTGGQYCTSQC
jgi:hypothetical protein